MPINKREPGSQVTATLTSSDIEIGAVEIKDGKSDNRLEVDSSGRAYVHIDSRKILSTGGSLTGLASSTSYYSSTVNVMGTRSVTIFIYADAAISVEILAKFDDTEKPLANAKIDSTDFIVDSWNYIHIPIPLENVRIKFTTGTTPPSEIKWRLKAVI